MAGELIEAMVVGSPAAPEREQEFNECLRVNASCEEIGCILLVEEETPLTDARLSGVDQSKVEVVRLGRRMLWDDAAKLAQERTSGLCCVANADVCFDATLAKLRKWTRWSSSMVALSRDGKPDVGGADAWIFMPPLRMKPVASPLGQRFIDRRVCALAQDAGLLVVNPATSIVLRHVHASHPGYPDAWAPGRAPFPHAYSTLVSLDLEDQS